MSTGFNDAIGLCVELGLRRVTQSVEVVLLNGDPEIGSAGAEITVVGCELGGFRASAARATRRLSARLLGLPPLCTPRQGLVTLGDGSVCGS